MLGMAPERRGIVLAFWGEKTYSSSYGFASRSDQ